MSLTARDLTIGRMPVEPDHGYIEALVARLRGFDIRGRGPMTDQRGIQTGYYKPSSGIARWTLDNADTADSLAIDVWNNHDASIYGATTGASGANQTYDTGEAYNFNGSGDYLEAPSLGSGFSSGFSAAVWIKPVFQGTSNSNHILSYESGSDNDTIFRFEQDDDSTGELDFGVRNGTDSFAEISYTGLKEDVWNHIVGTFDGVTVDLYHNGSHVGSTSASLVNDSAKFFKIGARHTTQDYWEGNMDDLRIYIKGLSDSETNSLYTDGYI
ncbi:LamG domain-containing protein [Halanaeroarchaeum sulfurireducens]|uniref:Concanavalin A-like lectin/glucanases family protein n=1 Tax=Halanaeroarchaeum sulfurireducens TaxID=1604004 RepID=A0A0N9N7R8_9EURY|nr:LamG domain-containing protein [Halanaeroarchaeum sulfurireducens]ALG82889.1 concanavalin A-like lectin/glucanases family protein [Halanaeroarchaeum sulfurireducens]